MPPWSVCVPPWSVCVCVFKQYSPQAGGAEIRRQHEQGNAHVAPVFTDDNGHPCHAVNYNPSPPGPFNTGNFVLWKNCKHGA